MTTTMKLSLIAALAIGSSIAVITVAPAAEVGYWYFDDHSGLGVVGDTVPDHTANPVDGILESSGGGSVSIVVPTVQVPGAPAGNEVLQLVKSNSGNPRMQVNDPGAGSKFDLTTSGSIGLWVYLDPSFANPTHSDSLPLVNNAEGLVWKDQSSSYALGNNGEQYKMHLAEWGTGVGQNGPDTTAGDIYGAWYYATWTWDGSTSRLWVNGTDVLDRSYSGPLSTDDNPITIGGRSQNGYSITGAVDEVTIWNTALTQSQILALMTEFGQGGSAVPEPSTFALGLLGLVGLGLIAWKKRRQQ